MSGPNATDPHPKQRRNPRFPFDSLVHVTAFRLGTETRLWGRSTDLCQEGIGVTVAGELTLEEWVAMQIPLPAAEAVTVRASVRYCNQGHCGFEFMYLQDQQRKAMQAACQRLKNARQGLPEEP